MSKPIYIFGSKRYCNTNNTIECILNNLPTFDYEFIDTFNNYPHETKILCLAEFLFVVSLELLYKDNITHCATGLYYKEGDYSIHYGFCRYDKNKAYIASIVIHDDKETNIFAPYTVTGSGSFLLNIKITPEEYNVMKSYILNKCIHDKELIEGIFYRLYGNVI